jgi:hypothetical protein
MKMQESKLLKISWIILTAAIVVGMLLALAYVIRPFPFFVRDVFEAYTGQSWSTLVEQQPKHTALYEHFTREGSWYYFVLCFHALSIVLGSYRRGQKWAWFVLLFGYVSTCGALTVFGFIYTGAGGTWLGLVSLCVGIVALLLPAKDFLSREAPPAAAD